MPSSSYESHRDRAADRQSDQAREGRDIGPPPACANPKRREKCRHDLRKYLETYHKPAFPLKWSEKHLELISDIEKAVLEGQLKSVAMPRGSGKTTILERAILWAVLYRHHGFAFLLAATDAKARENLGSIKMELMCNDTLFEDFPELLHPLRELEWIANRCRGQHIGGEPTLVEWQKQQVTFPTIDGVPGPIIKVGGLLTAVRGSKVTHPTGAVVRPTIALIDDPQTRRSAKSKIQSDERAQIVSGDVLGMAGPGEPFAALMACTVIERADMADKVLNRELHPEWRGQRTKLLESFPDNMDLWEHYREILVDELRSGGDGQNATKFYRKHRKRMDAGAKVSWTDRFIKGKELSAIQAAMNLWYRDQDSFFSEYQNEPLDLAAADEGDVERLAREEIAARINHLPRNTLPAWANLVTAFVDVHDALLYFAVCAWGDDFSGAVVDYGTWPQQAAGYFTMRSAKTTIPRKWPALSNEARIRKALDALLDGDGGLMTREWTREGDGAALPVKLALIDGQYKGEDVVYPAILASPNRLRLMPSHGRGVTARQAPFAEYAKKPGEKRGLHWYIPRKASGKSVRHLVVDTNFWKTFTHARLATDPAERGALTLFKAQPKQHALLADHLSSEKAHREEARGRRIVEWEQVAGEDNHLSDAVVGCAVAASVEGCQLAIAGVPVAAREERTKLRLSDLQQAGRNRRASRLKLSELAAQRR